MIAAYKYRNAVDTSSGGWAVTDKIFGYLDKLGNVYQKIRYPQPGDPDYEEKLARLRAEQTGMFGLPEPWGIVIVIGGLALLGYGIYKISQ